MSHSCTDPSGLCTVLSGQTAFCANLGVEEIPDKLTMNVPFGMKNKANVNIVNTMTKLCVIFLICKLNWAKVSAK